MLNKLPPLRTFSIILLTLSISLPLLTGCGGGGEEKDERIYCPDPNFVGPCKQDPLSPESPQVTIPPTPSASKSI